MAGRETPATRALREAGVAFELREYEHDPGAGAYALEAAEALGLDPDTVFKTLVVDRDGSLTVCLVPAAAQLDTRALGKRVALAPPDGPRRSRATSPAASARSGSAASCRPSSTSWSRSSRPSGSAAAVAGWRSGSPPRTCRLLGASVGAIAR